MLMVQTAVATYVADHPDASPREVLRVVNAVVYENVRQRLFSDEHVTLTLLRYRSDGRVTFAGAHEEIVVCRAATGRCERIATPGTWLGAVFDVERFTTDSEVKLEPGDLLVLYTDGLVQGMDASGGQFGMDRLCAALERVRELPVGRIVETVLAESMRFAAAQEDDVTLLVARYTGERAGGTR
jgi:sigma-B regulation protein RsbU (phosphoserine phosphatase)